MPTIKPVRSSMLFSILFATLWPTNALAQVQDPTNLKLTIEAQSIQFSTSAGDVADWRLQIANTQGQQIYDGQVISGNALTWPLVDSQGQGIDSGIYSYILSVRGPGRQRSRQGQLLVQKTTNGYQVWSMSDSQAASAGDGETVLTVTGEPSPGDPSPTSATLPTNLGRASFGAVVGYIGGSGTTNVMTKWLDGPGGIVGDTTVSEYAGAVTIGNGTYYGTLQIFGGAANDLFAGMGPNIATGPAFNFGYAGASFGRSAGFFNVRPDASASPPNPSLRFMTANQQRMIITNLGKVGIGTLAPNHQLRIVGGPIWTNNGWTGSLELNNGSAIGWQPNDAGNSAGIGRTNGGLYFFTSPSEPGNDVSNATYQMFIADSGRIGIGTTTEPKATLEVRTHNGAATGPFVLTSSGGQELFQVFNGGATWVGLLGDVSTIHLCLDPTDGFNKNGYLAPCGSAAEYVPTVAGRHGYPRTADLVSLSVGEKNPEGDDHAPFVVAKSTTPCDAHLLGFIVNPESGADGKKLNDHYLPLAIYGYFPAKVTMENGPIRRGDGITSSSTPGAGMKATGGCKVIGYALEDADRDGTVQVFAHLDEQPGPELAALRGRVEGLTGENEALKRELTDIRERMAAAEALLRELLRESAPKAMVTKPLR